MINKRPTFAIILLLLSSPSWGKQSQSFLASHLGNSAKMIGSGNIQGFSDHASSVFGNPATIGRIKSPSFSLFNTRILNEIQYQQFASTFPFKNIPMGIGLMKTSVSQLHHSTLINDYPIIHHSFHYQHLELNHIIATRLSPHAYLGLKTSWIRTEIDQNIFNNINAGIGAYWTQSAHHYSLIINHLIKHPFHQNYQNQRISAHYPTQIIISHQFQSRHFSIRSQTKSHPTRNAMISALGIILHPTQVSLLSIYFGYSQHHNLDLIQASTGLSLNLNQLQLQYAFLPNSHPQVPQSHLFSLHWSLKKKT
ncbi:MAG: hypothetical protein CL521_05025 [Actinobacteria bacterium]|nr:hypothetical protein [Actinomycetota bacterium]